MPQTDPRDAQIAALREALEFAEASLTTTVLKSSEYSVSRYWLDRIITVRNDIKRALAAAPAAKQEPQCRFCGSEMQPGKVHDCPKRQAAKQEVGE